MLCLKSKMKRKPKQANTTVTSKTDNALKCFISIYFPISVIFLSKMLNQTFYSEIFFQAIQNTSFFLYTKSEFEWICNHILLVWHILKCTYCNLRKLLCTNAKINKLFSIFNYRYNYVRQKYKSLYSQT